MERSGDTMVVTPPIDAAGRTYDIGYTVTDSAGAQAQRQGHRDRHRTERAGTHRRRRPGPDHPGHGVSIPVLGQRHRPARARPHDRRGQRQRRFRHGDRVRRPRSSTSPSAGYFGATTFTYTVRTPARTAAGQGVGTVARHRDRATRHAVDPAGDRRQRHRHGHVGAPAGQRRAAHRASSCSPRGSAPITLGVTSSHTLTGLVNGRPYRFQVRAQNEAGLGRVERVGRPRSRPTRSRAACRRRASCSATGSSPSTGRHRPTRARRSPATRSRSAAGSTRSSPAARRPRTCGTGSRTAPTTSSASSPMNAAGRSDPSPWSDPEHPLRQPDTPGVPNVQRGNRFLDLALDAEPDQRRSGHRVPGADASNPNTWVPVGSGTTYRWSDLPNGVEQQFQVRSRNRDPDWSVDQRLVGRGQALRRPRSTRRARPRPAATDGPSSPTPLPGDQGCAISQIQIEASGGATQTAPGSPHTFTGLSNGTSYTFRVRAHERGGLGCLERCLQRRHARPVCRRARTRSRRRTPVSARSRPTWPAAAPNGCAAAALRDSRSTTAAPQNVGLTTSYDPRRADARTRPTASRCAPATTSTAGPGRRTRSVTTWGAPDQPGAPNASAGDGQISASWGAPAANGRPIDALRRRAQPRRQQGRRRDTRRRGTSPTARTTRCGCGRATSSAAHRGARGARRCTPQAPPPPVNVTASYYGNAQGQPGCGSSRCVYVRIEATGLQPNTTYTVTCNYPSNQGWSAHQRDHERSGRAPRRAGVLLRPGRGVLGDGRRPPIEHAAHPTALMPVHASTLTRPVPSVPPASESHTT